MTGEVGGDFEDEVAERGVFLLLTLSVLRLLFLVVVVEMTGGWEVEEGVWSCSICFLKLSIRAFGKDKGKEKEVRKGIKKKGGKGKHLFQQERLRVFLSLVVAPRIEELFRKGSKNTK